MAASRHSVLSRVALFALLAGAVLTACSLITSYDGLEGATKGDAAAPPVEASTADVVQPPPPDPCPSEGVPSPPDAGGAPGDLGPLVGAVRAVRLLDGDAGDAFGLNLDRTCGASCASSAAKPPQDPPSGIDNSVFNLFQTLKSAGLALTDKGFNDALAAGQWGLVLRLDKYSGAPDDDDVQLDLLNAAAVNVSGDGGLGTARLDGTDEWVTDSRSSVAGVPLFRSKVAYVRNNTLVARFERFPPTLRTSGGPGIVLLLEPEIFSVVVTAKIVSHDKAGLTLGGGTIAGAVTAEEFLLQIQRLGTCKDQEIFAVVADYVCGVRDLAATTVAPPTDKCTRVSMAIGFDTIPAQVSPKVKVVTDVRACDGGDPTQGCGAR